MTKKPTVPILGADTETHFGYARLLCIEDNPHRFTREIGDWKAWTNYLLDTHQRIAFYNLRFDIEAILKHFPEEMVKQLLYLTEVELRFNDQESWSFRLIPWKLFTIKEMVKDRNGRRRTNRKVECFEAAQFFQDTLGNASEKVLGEKKVEDRAFAQSLNTEERLWDTELDRIITYCQDDATKAGKLIRKFMESAAQEPISLSPKNPISCAWYAKELIKQCIPEAKKIKSIRNGSTPYYARPWKQWDNVGTQCYFGGHFETFKKGTWDEYVYNADINSAYPYWIARLPNPYNLAFVRDREPEGDWSMVKATVWVPEDLHMGPLPYRLPDTIIYPVGNWTGWFHWDELRNASRFGVEYDIHKCLNGFEPDGKQRPFEKRIPDMYDGRSKWKEVNDPRQLSAKVAMNSVYGVFYEKIERILGSEEGSTEIDGHVLSKQKDNPGRFSYPYLAGWVTMKTRVQIYNAAIPDATIFMATDGILSEKRLNLPISKKLGDWSEKKIEVARVFGNGIYELDGRMKTRGFRKDSNKDPRPVRDRMRVDPKTNHIMIDTIERGPIHLGMSFRMRDYSMKDALTWIEKHKEIDVTKCNKRSWPAFGINDLYERNWNSQPRRVDGNPTNANPGLFWDGKQVENVSDSARSLLGCIQV